MYYRVATNYIPITNLHKSGQKYRERRERQEVPLGPEDQRTIRLSRVVPLVPCYPAVLAYPDHHADREHLWLLSDSRPGDPEAPSVRFHPSLLQHPVTNNVTIIRLLPIQCSHISGLN